MSQSKAAWNKHNIVFLTLIAAAGGGAEGRTDGPNRGRVVSDFATFSHIEHVRQSSGHHHQQQGCVATAIKYPDSRAGNVLQAFDPLSSQKSGNQADGAAAGEPDEIVSTNFTETILCC